MVRPVSEEQGTFFAYKTFPLNIDYQFPPNLDQFEINEEGLGKLGVFSQESGFIHSKPFIKYYCVLCFTSFPAGNAFRILRLEDAKERPLINQFYTYWIEAEAYDNVLERLIILAGFVPKGKVSNL